jgi:hypothetical protein
VLVDRVPWAEGCQFTRGRYHGLHLLSWGIAPRDKLATYRQLRAMDLRPGGFDPVAVLFFHSRKGNRMVFASLYLIALAKPVRPMTDAKWCAVAAARAARCVCPACQQVKPYCIRTSIGHCWDCDRAEQPVIASTTRAVAA